MNSEFELAMQEVARRFVAGETLEEISRDLMEPKPNCMGMMAGLEALRGWVDNAERLACDYGGYTREEAQVLVADFLLESYADNVEKFSSLFGGE